MTMIIIDYILRIDTGHTSKSSTLPISISFMINISDSGFELLYCFQAFSKRELHWEIIYLHDIYDATMYFTRHRLIMPPRKAFLFTKEKLSFTDTRNTFTILFLSYCAHNDVHIRYDIEIGLIGQPHLLWHFKDLYLRPDRYHCHFWLIIRASFDIFSSILFEAISCYFHFLSANKHFDSIFHVALMIFFMIVDSPQKEIRKMLHIYF